MSPTNGKQVHFDSLRGLAASVVVLAHYAGAFYPHALLGDRFMARSPVESWLVIPPFSLAMAGHAAVCLFFILSGYVLSVSLLQVPLAGRRESAVQAMIRRPFRLGGLCLATVVLGFLIMRFFPLQLWSEGLPWLAGFWKEKPTWSEFLSEILLRPFAHGERVNPPLWTIDKELSGSYIVFVFVAASIHWSPKVRIYALLLLGLFTYRTLYVGFVIGIAFAEIATSGWLARRAAGFRKAAPWILLAGLLCACQPNYGHRPFDSQHATWVAHILHRISEFGTGGVVMLGAVLIFMSALTWPRSQQWLAMGWLTHLGHISFALYALHFLLLGSLSAAIHSACVSLLGHDLAALTAMLISLPVLWLLAVICTRYIDQPTIALSRSAGKKIHCALKRLAQRSAFTLRPAPANVSGPEQPSSGLAQS